MLIATSPQVTQSQANLTRHDFKFAPDQKQMWLHLEVLSNKSIQNGDLFQSEIHFDLKSNEESPIIEQQRWQLIAYSPVNQAVKWVEDLALIQEGSSASMNLSLQVCDANVPSIIIYKLNFINFMIFKLLVNVKFANIINIINNKEVIPELLQSECNAKEIYNSVLYMLKNPEIGKKQLEQCNQTLKGIRSNSSSSNEVATILRNSLVG